MTSSLRVIGVAATLVIAIVLVTVILSEPQRQQIAISDHHVRSISQVIDIYAHNCVECHGPAGEGSDINPVLNDETVRFKDPIQLYRVIERGRYGTDMAAFGINEGGNLTNVQIEGLVTLIRHGDWDAVFSRAAQLDLLPTATPPAVPPSITPSPSETPAVTISVVPAQGGIFGVIPSSTSKPDGSSPSVTLPVFEVIPTENPRDSLPMLEVVTTVTRSNDASQPFDVVPTYIPQIPVEPTEIDD